MDTQSEISVWVLYKGLGLRAQCLFLFVFLPSMLMCRWERLSAYWEELTARRTKS